jgi:protocatechuate 3,4-dioxygenase beta subunit
MSPGTKQAQLGRRAWLSAAITFAALLLVPFVAWLILPAPRHIAIPQVAAATVDEAPHPTRRIESSAPAPRPTESAKADGETGPVRGRVLGPDHQGVARALVGCTEKDVSTTTEHDGTFELPPSAAGCTATAHKQGFGASERVKLRPGDERANTLELRAGGRIEGVVVDEQGAPIPKFQIAVERFIGADGDDEGSNGRARTVENDRGQFVMESVTPGKYVLTAGADGKPPARTDMFEVEAGRSKTGLRIVLAKGVAVAGTITDAETRKPIAGARVELDAVSASGVAQAPSVRTDDNGAYSLDGAPPSGPFSIRVEKEGYRTRTMAGLEARGAGPVRGDVQLQPKGTGNAESELGGIGAVLGPAPDSLGAMVLATMKDSPAERAGLQKQDRIVRIDGTSADTLTLNDCIQRLRGEPGTRVTLWIKRGDQELQVNLTRALVVR